MCILFSILAFAASCRVHILEYTEWSEHAMFIILIGATTNCYSYEMSSITNFDCKNPIIRSIKYTNSGNVIKFTNKLFPMFS